MEGIIFDFNDKPECRLAEPAIRIKYKGDKLGSKVGSIREVFIIFGILSSQDGGASIELVTSAV